MYVGVVLRAPELCSPFRRMEGIEMQAPSRPRYFVSEHKDGRYGVWDSERETFVRRRQDMRMISVMYPEAAQVISDSLNQEWVLNHKEN